MLVLNISTAAIFQKVKVCSINAVASFTTLLRCEELSLLAAWRGLNEVSICCSMADNIYIHMGSSSQIVTLPTNPLPSCKEVVDTLGGGTIMEGDYLVLHSRILEANKRYTFIKEGTAGTCVG